jgi:hypothetical protein
MTRKSQNTGNTGQKPTGKGVGLLQAYYRFTYIVRVKLWIRRPQVAYYPSKPIAYVEAVPIILLLGHPQGCGALPFIKKIQSAAAISIRAAMIRNSMLPAKLFSFGVSFGG